MKRFALSLLLFGFGLFVALSIAEVMVRILAPHSRDRVVPPGMFAIDPALGWKLQPGYARRHQTRYFDVEYVINMLGFRDRFRNVTATDSTVRVLMFGDSQIFGWGVERDQRFTDLVESRAQGVQVWNMAVPGYGFDQQVISYQRVGVNIPSARVVFYASNATLARIHYGFIYGKPKPRFAADSSGRTVVVPPETGSVGVIDAFYRLFSRFYLPYFLEAMLLNVSSRYADDTASTRDLTPVEPAAMDLLKRMLLHAVPIAASRDHELMLLVSLPEESMKELTAFCASNGITLLTTGWPVASGEMVFGPHDQHWTPNTHAVLARRLAPALARKATTSR